MLTTKHHDGYAMFDTHVSDYSVMHSPYGRDIVRQFVEAMRAEGIRVGLKSSSVRAEAGQVLNTLREKVRGLLLERSWCQLISRT